MLQDELIAEFIATEDKRMEAFDKVKKAKKDAAPFYNEAINMQKGLLERITDEIEAAKGAEAEETKYLHSLGSGVCRGLYLCHKALGKLVLSEIYFKLFEKYSLQSDYDYVLGFYHQELARRQTNQGKNKEAIINYKKSIDHFIQSEQTDEIPEIAFELSQLYVRDKLFDEADSVCHETINKLKIKQQTETTKTLESKLLRINEERRDYQKNKDFFDSE